MPRRLRLPSSSDEDEDNQTLRTLTSRNLQNDCRGSGHNPNASATDPGPPFEVVDDDDFDAPETISPTSEIARLLDEFLRRIGLRLRSEWLDSCIAGLSASYSGFAALDVEAKAKLCFSHFLFSDMNFSGSGSLPPAVHAMHGLELAGPFVLQVDEIVNICLPLRERYQNTSAGHKRCLKLLMTDGVQQVVGMEYRPIKGLEVLAPAGLKVCLRNVCVRRGLLMLVPEVLEVLGGLVEELDAARQRFVQEVNKPPRGKRRRNGEVLSLAARAQRAAWPSNGASDNTQLNSSISQLADSSHPLGPGGASATHGTVYVTNRPGLATSNSRLDAEANTRSSNTVLDANTPIISPADAGELNYTDVSAPRNITDGEVPILSSNMTSSVATLDAPVNDARGISRRTSSIPLSRNVEGNCPSSGISMIEPLAGYNCGIGECIEKGFPSAAAETIPCLDSVLDMGASSSCRINDQDVYSSISILERDEVHKAPLFLSGEKEIPFTYLACLLAKWTANKSLVSVIHGKIKCFLTGVKKFQFKHRSTYELYAYVDDGSLISEVLIDHKVVHTGIGHSPEEVTAALSSSDKKLVANMKEIMKQYQLFLAKFEGTMLVEMNNSSTVPIALEMDQGCTQSDAWMLLQRLSVSLAPQSPKCRRSSPITLSP